MHSLDRLRDTRKLHVLPASVASPFVLFPATFAKSRRGSQLGWHLDDTSNKIQDRNAAIFYNEYEDFLKYFFAARQTSKRASNAPGT
jgi:hypothetical protein